MRVNGDGRIVSRVPSVLRIARNIMESKSAGHGRDLKQTGGVIYGEISRMPTRAIRDTWGQITSVVTPEVASSEQLEITVISINPTSEPGPRHYHAKAENAFILLEGEAIMTVDGEEIRLTAGDFAWVPPGVIHEVRNGSARTQVRLIEIYGPAGKDFNVVDSDDVQDA